MHLLGFIQPLNMQTHKHAHKHTLEKNTSEKLFLINWKGKHLPRLLHYGKGVKSSTEQAVAGVHLL